MIYFSEEEKKELIARMEKYVSDLKAIEIGTTKEIVEDDFKSHFIKRIDKHTWEYTCDCCNGRRLSIGSTGISDTGVHEKSCTTCGKKWCNCE